MNKVTIVEKIQSVNLFSISRNKLQVALSVFLLAGLAFLCFANGAVPEEKLIKAYGHLTSIQLDGSIIIHEKKYKVLPSANVLNWEGTPVTLHRFDLPTRVYFEYEHTETGPVIKLIRESVE